MGRERSTRGARGRRLGAPVAATAAIAAGTAILMLGYEVAKEFLFPNFTKWESHFVTIAFAGLCAGLAGYLVSRRLHRANAELWVENAVRVEAEAEAKRAYEEKAVLLKELQHRAKNSFAMIASLFSLARADELSPSCDKLLGETEARVRAIADLYDLLYATGSVRQVELGAYLAKIAAAIVDRPGIELRTDVEPGAAAADQAVVLGLLVTELSTNAVKHAFPPGRVGSVSLVARFEGQGLRLEFSDDGVGAPPGLEAESSGSLGLSLVRALAKQLHGAWELEPSPGMAWRFRFPRVGRLAG